MLRVVAGRLGCPTAAATVGRQGCLCIRSAGEIFSAPALARRVVDRNGAGDAFFAMTTLCALEQAPLDVLTFLGNLAGAEAVATLGNAERSAGASLPRSVASLLR